MAQFHISGRPRPLRVPAIMDPSEPPVVAAAQVSRGLRSTMILVPPGQQRAPSRLLWPLAGCVGALAVVLAVWLHPAPPPAEVPIAVRAPKAVRAPVYSSTAKPVVTDENWTYGRTGAPPRQTLPTQTALVAYKNDLDQMAEKQRKQAEKIP